MNQRLVIRRDSDDENAFAVVDFAGCKPTELFGKVKKAVAAWSKNVEGSESIEPGCFNILELSQFTPCGFGKCDKLSVCLFQEGITWLNIEVYSSLSPNGGWEFDTNLLGE